MSASVWSHLLMSHSIQKFGPGEKWWTVLFSKRYDRVAKKRANHCTRKENDAFVRNVLTRRGNSCYFKIKGTKLCRFLSKACRTIFQISTAHSNELKRQPHWKCFPSYQAFCLFCCPLGLRSSNKDIFPALRVLISTSFPQLWQPSFFSWRLRNEAFALRHASVGFCYQAKKQRCHV